MVLKDNLVRFTNFLRFGWYFIAKTRVVSQTFYYKWKTWKLIHSPQWSPKSLAPRSTIHHPQFKVFYIPLTIIVQFQSKNFSLLGLVTTSTVQSILHSTVNTPYSKMAGDKASFRAKYSFEFFRWDQGNKGQLTVRQKSNVFSAILE